MRSMSMLQLLGGVAAAGVVAAGATAFTNSGVTMPGSVFIGGSAAITPVGEQITSIVANWAVSNTQITSFTVTFTGSNADGKTPTLVVTDASGTYANGGAQTGAPTFGCTSTTASVSTCTVNGGSSAYAPNAISNITVTVV
jgi:hypothetical protein